ncbi:MAG: hypothetical protein WDW36_010219 [Sanguina aurantia]
MDFLKDVVAAAPDLQQGDAPEEQEAVKRRRTSAPASAANPALSTHDSGSATAFDAAAGISCVPAPLNTPLPGVSPAAVFAFDGSGRPGSAKAASLLPTAGSLHAPSPSSEGVPPPSGPPKRQRVSAKAKAAAAAAAAAEGGGGDGDDDEYDPSSKGPEAGSGRGRGRRGPGTGRGRGRGRAGAQKGKDPEVDTTAANPAAGSLQSHPAASPTALSPHTLPASSSPALPQQQHSMGMGMAPPMLPSLGAFAQPDSAALLLLQQLQQQQQLLAAAGSGFPLAPSLSGLGQPQNPSALSMLAVLAQLSSNPLTSPPRVGGLGSSAGLNTRGLPPQLQALISSAATAPPGTLQQMLATSAAAAAAAAAAAQLGPGTAPTQPSTGLQFPFVGAGAAPMQPNVGMQLPFGMPPGMVMQPGFPYPTVPHTLPAGLPVSNQLPVSQQQPHTPSAMPTAQPTPSPVQTALPSSLPFSSPAHVLDGSTHHRGTTEMAGSDQHGLRPRGPEQAGGSGFPSVGVSQGSVSQSVAQAPTSRSPPAPLQQDGGDASRIGVQAVGAMHAVAGVQQQQQQQLPGISSHAEVPPPMTVPGVGGVSLSHFNAPLADDMEDDYDS